MNRRERTCRTLVIASLLVAPGLLWGCGAGGGGEDPVANEPAKPAVDPRLATADALIDTFNQAVQPPYDLTSIGSFFVAETPEQEALVNLVRDTMPLAEFALLVEDKFPGEQSDIINNNDAATMIGALGQATIVERSPQRVTAEVTADNGESGQLMLVQMQPDGPWAISGYTIEHEFESDDDLAQVKEMMGTPFIQTIVTMGQQIMPDLNRRIRANEFASIKELEAAYMQAFMQFGQNNPDFVQNMMQNMTQNPNFENPFGQ